ncbi:putative 37S ribosomal protein S28, mitochondrial [Neolecta irregularis DAH-3]|uniref:Putative 37S ribosomal protein S28, mitochondrial n=1 Tax=Neolecta irregularis (strain DAH-3) TaxID=1198029 RepID=A0A1U7LMY4_NEOID|nr:putative 37S ribosomal protein S28, mitochondrial [Neolecta irregularis DAH-3]|eukprot:OLL24015.1 putative 37S ribosomal protein S28, mitochondrial [Neolecta irregularis DAH-3]
MIPVFQTVGIRPAISPFLLSFKSQFHTSTSLNLKYKSSLAVRRRKKNQERRAEILKKKHENKSDPIFGVKTAFTETLFRQSDLYSFSVEKTDGALPVNYIPQYWPNHTSWIRGATDAGKTFEACKFAKALRFDPLQEEIDKSVTSAAKDDLGIVGDLRTVFDSESNKRDAIGRIMDLRNSNTKTLRLRNIQLAIERFSRKPGDTGSPEVQAAVMTTKIIFLGNHVKTQNHDKHNARRLRILVHKRAAMLKYLRRESPKRYLECIKSLGLDNSVLREITLKL